MMSYYEREHLVRTINKDVRYDGRSNKDFRNFEIQTNIIETAEGSARIKLGNTEIIAGVKLSIGEPYPDRPNEGVLMVGCELLPIAHVSIESGPPSIDAIEIGRVIDRGIRESKTIDVEQLVIEPGKKVWIVSVDLVPLNHDGNIIDAGAIAAIMALKNTKLPELLENGNVDYKHLSNKKALEIKTLPIAITVGKIGENLIVDPNKEEEDCLDARLTVTVTDEGNFCSLQKGGEVGFSSEEISTIFDLAIEKSNEIRAKLN